MTIHNNQVDTYSETTSASCQLAKQPAIEGETPKGPQPPAVPLLFQGCHGDRARFEVFREAGRSGLRMSRNADHLALLSPSDLPTPFRNANADGGDVEAWIRNQVGANLKLLDTFTWDVAVCAIIAFYQRTSGTSVAERFDLHVDDYLHWRSVDPRNRSAAMRREVVKRIELLTQLQVCTEGSLYLTNPQTGRKRRSAVVGRGPFLVETERLYEKSDALADPFAFRLALGEWARGYVEESAMLGVYPRPLAHYDIRRQGWERRIGWYLTFQMNCQASRMKFEQIQGQVVATPQQPLFLKTVLENSHVPWLALAETDPGKVISQFQDAITQLRNDGILSDCQCLDGLGDGSDLPRKGKLLKMLKHRYLFFPGPQIVSHLTAKSNAASRFKDRSRPVSSLERKQKQAN